MFFRAAKGFMLAISDVRDQPVIEQDGYYIAPGSAGYVTFFLLQLQCKPLNVITDNVIIRLM
jgi:hypothetical protein